MKVGYTYVIRLAGKTFAPAQAFYKSLLPVFTGLLMLFNAEPTIASSSPHEQIANRHSSIVNPIVIPFKLVGQSMFVQATINDQTGTFLFDTGASDLILNSAYFTGLDEQSEVVGLYGEVISVKHFLAHQIVLSGTSVAKDIALVLDLSAMEKAKKMPIAGILGYSVLKDYELQIDFDSLQIMLFSLKSNGRREQESPYSSSDAYDFKMSGHIPYLVVRLGDKTIRMGIDSGSERNILQSDMLEAENFEPTGQINLAGLSPKVKRQEKGYVKSLRIGDVSLDKLEVVLADFKEVSQELPVQLHGILGVQFLRQYKVAINFQLRKIYLWQPTEAANECRLAICTM